MNIGLLNLTQNDGDGGTSDISILYQDGTKSNYSVTQWTGKVRKCIRNPSPMHLYNLQKHKKYIEKENKKVYDSAVIIAKKTHGEAPSYEWKRRKFLPVAVFTEKLARMSSEEWNEFTPYEKRSRLIKFF